MTPDSTPLVSPIAPSAVYRIPDLDALERLYEFNGLIYARDKHPNGAELAEAINAWEHAAWGVMTGSGMAALSLAFLAICKPGDRILASDQLYGRTIGLLHGLERFGLKVDFVDTFNLPSTQAALQLPTAVLLVESISNPMVRVAEIRRLADSAHAAGASLLVDNTFAGPTIKRPLAEGADLVMESLSKIMNGHSDLMLGYLGGGDPARQSAVMETATTWGYYASPFDCWLALRGLSTLPLRMQASEANARKLAAWLRQRGLTVHYPGVSNMLSFELPGGRDAVNKFIQTVPVPLCPSLGHHETTLSYPWRTSHRAVADAEKLRLGITPSLIRVSVGCEDSELLQQRFSLGLPDEANKITP